MSKYRLIAVDIQNEFASLGGKFYTPKPSTTFLKEELFPFLEKKGLRIDEIISDYRQPRPGDRGDGCHPGQWGYESLVPSDLRKSLWVKCMNSPVWIRENIGNKDDKAGLPYPDPQKFGEWLSTNIGKPEETVPVLFGFTIDCCVLSTAQELNWRGYKPLILREGVDHASGKIEDRDAVLKTPASNWGKPISWNELKEKLEID